MDNMDIECIMHNIALSQLDVLDEFVDEMWNSEIC